MNRQFPNSGNITAESARAAREAYLAAIDKSSLCSECGGSPAGHSDNCSHNVKGVVVIAWSPEFVTTAEYARLVSLLGDLVRAEGGVGVTRIR